MKLHLKVFFSSLAAVVITLFFMSSISLADTLQSNNYRFIESALGGSSQLDAQSANFQASTSSSLLGLDNLASSNLQVNAGHLTTPDPTLTFSVNNSNVNFPEFSASQASTATTTFQVIDYTSYGYTVQVFGNPPKQGTHTIAAMTSTTASQAGIEQFGMNLVANTSPLNPLGANPDHGSFGFGSAAANYNTANNFRFVSGETIASAPKSSGLTVYTISYIINVSALTPAGQYIGNQTLLCTGTF